MRPELVVLVAALAVSLLSVPVYAVGRRWRGSDPLAGGDDRGSFVLGPFVRNWFYWLIGPLEWASLALGLGPLFYNLAGVVWGALGGWAFAAGHHALGGWAVLLGGVADILDGRIARARGVASPRGAFLDSTLDRFAELAPFVGLAVSFRGVPWALAVVATALGGSLLVSYTRARGESLGVLCKLGVMQRAERLILLGFAGILDPAASAAWRGMPWADGGGGVLLLPALALIALGTMGTAVFRTVWIARRLPGVDPPSSR